MSTTQDSSRALSTIQIDMIRGDDFIETFSFPSSVPLSGLSTARINFFASDGSLLRAVNLGSGLTVSGQDMTLTFSASTTQSFPIGTIEGDLEMVISGFKRTYLLIKLNIAADITI